MIFLFPVPVKLRSLICWLRIPVSSWKTLVGSVKLPIPTLYIIKNKWKTGLWEIKHPIYYCCHFQDSFWVSDGPHKLSSCYLHYSSRIVGVPQFCISPATSSGLQGIIRLWLTWLCTDSPSIAFLVILAVASPLG